MASEKKVLVKVVFTLLFLWNVTVGSIAGIFRYMQLAFTSESSVRACIESSYLEPLSSPGVVIACWIVKPAT